MPKRNEKLLIAVIRPPLLLLGFVVKTIYLTVIGWWLDPWLQRKQHRALLDDVERNLYFIVSQATAITSPSEVLPFDYASVEIVWENLFLVVTRGREELNLSIAPNHARDELSQLGPTIAALENRHFSERDAIYSLAEAAALLRPRLQFLNAAFSPQEYARTKTRI